MKPIRLEFNGIKSYTEKAVIDFSKLTSGGIFGIFGNTGSGKSTILDSILLALYGRLPKTNRASEFLNNYAQNGYVEFTFSMLDRNVVKTYQVRREFKIRETSQVTYHKAFLYEVEGDVKNPLSEGVDTTNLLVEEIVGLRLDDFKKCIILPQGEFSAFVTLTSSGRLAMMSSLFNLDKYGDKLRSQVKYKKEELEKRLSEVKGELSAYSEDTLESLEKLKTEINLYEKEKITLDVNFKEIEDKFLKNEKNYETHKKLEKDRIRLEDLKILRDEFNRKKYSLDKFSFSKQARLIYSKKQELQVLIDKEKNDLSKELLLKESLVDKFEKLQNKKMQLSKLDAELVDINSKLAVLDTLTFDIEINQNRKTQLDKLRTQRKELTVQKSQLEKQVENIVFELNEIKNNYEIKNVKQDVSALLRKIENSTDDNFLKEEIEFLSRLVLELTDNVKVTVENRIVVIKNMIKSDCGDDIRNLLQKLNSLYDENDKFVKNINQLENNLALKKSTLDNVNLQISIVDEKGVSLRADYDKTQEKIDKFLLGKNFDEVKNILISRKNEIEEFKVNIEIEEKKLVERKTQVIANIESLNVKIDAFSKQLVDLIQEYDDLVKNNFTDEMEVNKIFNLVNGNFDSLNEQVSKYFNDVYALTTSVKELSEELEKVDFSLENYKIIKDEYLFLQEKVKNNNNILYKLQNDYKNKSQNFEKRCIIENTKKQLEKEFSLNSQLSDVLRNNSLLSFVAEEYLKEIAQIAKMTLLTLTDGRFGLCYEKDFYVEDNILGGQKRTVNTVSGGELFLVSLSLALALSKSIYSKSQKPIEFFFLDEGFGSLDKDLVETVMDCLNKLKDKQLTIGVISHVESLKERISDKILVTPASEVSGSKVTVI